MSHLEVPAPGRSGLDLPAPGRSGLDLPAPGRSGLDLPAPGRSGLDLPAPGRSGLDLPAPGRSGLVWLDGVPVPLAGARVSVLDYGFLHGDSVYEVLRTSPARRLIHSEEHLARLEVSARRLRLPLPWSRAQLRDELEQAVAVAGYPECYLRLIVTRGVPGGAGLEPPGSAVLAPAACARPWRVLLVDRLQPLSDRLKSEGLRLVLVDQERNPSSVVDPAVKSGSYLGSILALHEARASGADDGLMCNTAGLLTECTTSNFFFVSGGVVHTPSLDCGILSGVTRATLIAEHAPACGISVTQGRYLPQHLAGCDEAFITSSLKGVVPVGWIDGRRLPEPVPGPITRKLMAVVE